MKRYLLWISVILVSILISTLSLAGCKTATATETTSETIAAATTAAVETTATATTAAETTAAGEKITITHIHWTQPPYDDIILKTAKDFMAENPNVEVKVLFYPTGDLATKIKTAISSGGECDTFASGNFESAFFIENGLVEEIIPSAFGKETVQEVVDMWVPNAFQMVGSYYQGKYLGIPHELSNWVGWINTAYMKEAGLDPAKDIPKTWEEYTNVCKKMIKIENGVIVRNGTAVNLKSPLFPFLIINALMQQKGLDWTTEKGLLESLDKPEAVEAFATFTDWAIKDKIFGPALFEDEREGFGNGLSATFLTGGTWHWGVLDSYSVARKDVMPFKYPRFENGKDIGGPAYGMAVYVSKQSKNKEMAWKWLNYLESRPEEYIKNGYYQPRKSLDNKLIEEYIPNNDIFVSELAKGSAILVSANLPEIYDSVGKAIDSVLFGGNSNEEALKQLKVDVEDIITK